MADDSSPLDGLLDTLDARATSTVKGGTAHWRCRVLTPTEAVELSVAFGMLQAAVAEATGTTGRPATEPTPGAKVSILAHMQRIACAVVIEASVAGKSWAPIRLVERHDDHDRKASPPRIYIGAIDPADVAAIAFAATSSYRGARAAVAGFPAGSDAPPGSGLDGSALRDETVAGGA